MNRRRFTGGGLAAGAALWGGSSPGAEDTSFYVPAEEEPHARTFIQWPVSRRVYRDVAFLEDVQATIAQIANTVAEFEDVVMLADAEHHGSARRLLSETVTLWDVPTEDLWCRDSGPLFVRNEAGDLAIRHIRFNGWGGKQRHRRDGAIAELVAERLGLKLLPSPLRGEPGGVEQDGHGLLMAHESSWVNINRNPGMSRDEIGEALLHAYGAEKLIWAPGLLAEDITDFHIDGLARFSGPGRVLIMLPDVPDPDDPFHLAALETHDILAGAGLDIHVIPEPFAPRVRHHDFVASYPNYYACNGAVIAAEFGDRETDRIAASMLAEHYPDRDVVTLNVDPLGEIGGGIHCATQQMPLV